jgi:release factor glutamine methyltransferase
LTLRVRLAAARAQLSLAGIPGEEAAVDVDVLARRILGWDKARLLTELSQRMPDALEPALSALLAKRERREPTAYILGEKEFWGRSFVVSPAVLIPRPETELIVEEALRLARDGALGDAPLRVADVGTGSGCLAVSLAGDLPTCRVTATDTSTAALDVARTNAIRYGVSDWIDFVRAPYLDGVEGVFDLVVSNPPYVPERDRFGLAPEVLCEPEDALFAGPDGLRDVRAILERAPSWLRLGGWLMIEFGFGQAEAVHSLVEANPSLRLQGMRRDLQGIPRTVIIERQ